MKILCFLLSVVVIYGLYSWLVFNPALKTKPWIIYAGLGCALVGNLLWVLLARATIDNGRLIYYGLWWDTLITASTFLIPVLCYGIRFSGTALIGLAVTIVGLLLMKYGTTT